jgi:hypothetical protein
MADRVKHLFEEGLTLLAPKPRVNDACNATHEKFPRFRDWLFQHLGAAFPLAFPYIRFACAAGAFLATPKQVRQATPTHREIYTHPPSSSLVCKFAANAVHPIERSPPHSKTRKTRTNLKDMLEPRQIA